MPNHTRTMTQADGAFYMPDTTYGIAYDNQRVYWNIRPQSAFEILWAYAPGYRAMVSLPSTGTLNDYSPSPTSTNVFEFVFYDPVSLDRRETLNLSSAFTSARPSGGLVGHTYQAVGCAVDESNRAHFLIIGDAFTSPVPVTGERPMWWYTSVDLNASTLTLGSVDLIATGEFEMGSPDWKYTSGQSSNYNRTQLASIAVTEGGTPMVVLPANGSVMGDTKAQLDLYVKPHCESTSWTGYALESGGDYHFEAMSARRSYTTTGSKNKVHFVYTKNADPGSWSSPSYDTDFEARTATVNTGTFGVTLSTAQTYTRAPNQTNDSNEDWVMNLSQFYTWSNAARTTGGFAFQSWYRNGSVTQPRWYVGSEDATTGVMPTSVTNTAISTGGYAIDSTAYNDVFRSFVHRLYPPAYRETPIVCDRDAGVYDTRRFQYPSNGLASASDINYVINASQSNTDRSGGVFDCRNLPCLDFDDAYFVHATSGSSTLKRVLLAINDITGSTAPQNIGSKSFMGWTANSRMAYNYTSAVNGVDTYNVLSINRDAGDFLLAFFQIGNTETVSSVYVTDLGDNSAGQFTIIDNRVDTINSKSFRFITAYKCVTADFTSTSTVSIKWGATLASATTLRSDLATFKGIDFNDPWTSGNLSFGTFSNSTVLQVASLAAPAGKLAVGLSSTSEYSNSNISGIRPRNNISASPNGQPGVNDTLWRTISGPTSDSYYDHQLQFKYLPEAETVASYVSNAGGARGAGVVVALNVDQDYTDRWQVPYDLEGTAIPYQATYTGDVSVDSSQKTFAWTVKAGSTVIVTVCSSKHGITSCSDTVAGTYTNLSDSNWACRYYANHPGGSVTLTVGVSTTESGNDNYSVRVLEVRGTSTRNGILSTASTSGATLSSTSRFYDAPSVSLSDGRSITPKIHSGYLSSGTFKALSMVIKTGSGEELVACFGDMGENAATDTAQANSGYYPRSPDGTKAGSGLVVAPGWIGLKYYEKFYSTQQAADGQAVYRMYRVGRIREQDDAKTISGSLGAYPLPAIGEANVERAAVDITTTYTPP